MQIAYRYRHFPPARMFETLLRKPAAGLKHFLNRKLSAKRPQWSLRDPTQLAFEVRQSGNSVEIAGEDFRARFEVDGIELPANTDISFAVWQLLPTAMSLGFDIRLDGPVDPVVIDNAEAMSRIWEFWLPQTFRSVRVFGNGEWTSSPAARKPAVHLFSGGVDSTFSLLTRGHAVEGGHVLTIQGLDYRIGSEDAAFATLLQKTDPLLEHLNYRRIVLRTDVRDRSPLVSATPKEDSAITHGFRLAGCVFLLRNLFERGSIAADHPVEQDMVAFPWGTNAVTNPYFAGSDFRMTTEDINCWRSQKIAAIAADPVALASVSFCAKRKFHPRNCGRCDKCVRTKAMFMAVTGGCPDIFLKRDLTERQIDALDLTSGNERAFFLDLYFAARRNGRLADIPGLERRMQDVRSGG